MSKNTKDILIIVGISLVVILVIITSILIYKNKGKEEVGNVSVNSISNNKTKSQENISTEKEIKEDDDISIIEPVEEEEIIEFASNELAGIEEYIEILHSYRTSIPDFNDIKEANKEWFWITVRFLIDRAYSKAGDNYISYDGITKIANMIFGDDCNVNFPVEGNKYLKYENGYYNFSSYFEWPEGGYSPSYVIKDIVKQEDNIYKARILEYIAVFNWEMIFEGRDENTVRLYKDNYENYEQYIKEFLNYDSVIGEFEIKDYVLKNADKFTTKELLIKLNEDNTFNIISCKTIK